jgi:hypothetical protein
MNLELCILSTSTGCLHENFKILKGTTNTALKMKAVCFTKTFTSASKPHGVAIQKTNINNSGRS